MRLLNITSFFIAVAAGVSLAVAGLFAVLDGQILRPIVTLGLFAVCVAVARASLRGE